MYLLPASPEHYEQFQWLAQEVQRAGGEATLLQVERIENLAPAELVRLFQTARERDYQAVTEAYRRLLGGSSPAPAGPPAPSGRRTTGRGSRGSSSG